MTAKFYFLYFLRIFLELLYSDATYGQDSSQYIGTYNSVALTPRWIKINQLAHINKILYVLQQTSMKIRSLMSYPYMYRQIYRQTIKYPLKTFCTDSKTYSDIQSMILQHTELTREHKTPEIALHLITKYCPLWSSKGDNSPFVDPFWAFYWPGGQVMTRYILDHADQFTNQSVLDLGSGCGASAIACRMVGANRVLANDIDTVAVEAIKLNSQVNNASVDTSSSNLIGQTNPDWTTIILGDMFYDETFRDILIDWLSDQCRRYKTNILIGDPGRLPLTDLPIKTLLTKVAEYELSEGCRKENAGFSAGYIWKFKPH